MIHVHVVTSFTMNSLKLTLLSFTNTDFWLKKRTLVKRASEKLITVSEGSIMYYNISVFKYELIIIWKTQRVPQ